VYFTKKTDEGIFALLTTENRGSPRREGVSIDSRPAPGEKSKRGTSESLTKLRMNNA